MAKFYSGVNSHIPRPNYDKDVNKIVKEFEKALRLLDAQLADAMLDDMRRGFALNYDIQIRRVIEDLNGVITKESVELIEKAARNGVADTMLSLGYAKTRKEALEIAVFGELNRPFIEAVIMDTQSDLLAVTQNVERRTKQAVRQAVAESIRIKHASGGGKTQEIAKDVLTRLKKQSNVAIVDASGRKWKTQTYVQMAVETKAMNAHRDAARNSGLEEGANYGIISSHNAVDACRHYEGSIVSFLPNDEKYPYVDDIPRSEFMHPRCKHIITPIRNPERYEE